MTEKVIGKVRVRRDGQEELLSVTKDLKLVTEDGRMLDVDPADRAMFLERMIPLDLPEKVRDRGDGRTGILKTVLIVCILALQAAALFFLISGAPGSRSRETGPGETSFSRITASRSISRGEPIVPSCLESRTLDVSEYLHISGETYVVPGGGTADRILIPSRSAGKITGMYAGRDIPEGDLITLRDLSFSKPAAGAFLVELEVDGEKVSIPLDFDAFEGGDSRVDVIAVFSNPGKEGSRAALLSSFTFADSRLRSIRSSLGEELSALLEDES